MLRWRQEKKAGYWLNYSGKHLNEGTPCITSHSTPLLYHLAYTTTATSSDWLNPNRTEPISYHKAPCPVALHCIEIPKKRGSICTARLNELFCFT